MDVNESTAVAAFMQSTCGCKKGLGSKPCSSQFSADHLLSVRASCFELTCSELDMVVMGQLMAGMNDDTTTNTASGHRGKDCQRASCTFHHQGKPICEKVFKFLHTRRNPLEESEEESSVPGTSNLNSQESEAESSSCPVTLFN